MSLRPAACVTRKLSIVIGCRSRGTNFLYRNKFYVRACLPVNELAFVNHHAHKLNKYIQVPPGGIKDCFSGPLEKRRRVSCYDARGPGRRPGLFNSFGFLTRMNQLLLKIGSALTYLL